MRDSEISRLNKLIESKDTDFNLMEANSNMFEEKYNDLDAELDLKAKENN